MALSVVFYYNIPNMEWCYICSIIAFVIACLFALWALISLFQWIIERRRRKASQWHKRYMEMTTAANTRKIILELPPNPKSPQNQVYTALPPYPIAKAKNHKNKSKRK